MMTPNEKRAQSVYIRERAERRIRGSGYARRESKDRNNAKRLMSWPSLGGSSRAKGIIHR